MIYRERWGLLFIALLSLAFRMAGVAADPHYLFDEACYIPSALVLLGRSIPAHSLVHGPPGLDPNLFSAPPFAKELIALSISLFGNNPWGWCLPSVLLGTMVPLLTFDLVRQWFPREHWAPWIAALLTAGDGLMITLSRVALLDSYAFPALVFNAWMLTRIVQIVQTQRPFSARFVGLWGISLGLGFACKWNGAQMILLSWLVLAFTSHGWIEWPWRRRLLLWSAPTIIAAASYLCTYLYAWPAGFQHPHILPAGFLPGECAWPTPPFLEVACEHALTPL